MSGTSGLWASGATSDHLLISMAGQLHVRDGRPNQDAAGFLRHSRGLGLVPILTGSIIDSALCGDLVESLRNRSESTSPEFCALAVSDGHGGKKYDRSERGSALAVCLMLHVAVLGAIRLCSEQPGTKDWLLYEVPRHLVRQWKQHVLQDDSSQGCHPASTVEDNDAIIQRYGATILGALTTDKGSVFWQLGDGDLILVNDNGVVSHPIDRQSDYIGTETDSLCLDSAEGAFRVSVQIGESHRDSLILLATDGVANSFIDDDAFQSFVRAISEYARGPRRETLSSSVPRWIARCSSYSGDDVSLSVLLPRIDSVDAKSKE